MNYHLRIYENLKMIEILNSVNLKLEAPPEPPERKQNDIKTFSKQSQQRLTKLVNSINIPESAQFITLTNVPIFDYENHKALFKNKTIYEAEVKKLKNLDLPYMDLQIEVDLINHIIKQEQEKFKNCMDNFFKRVSYHFPDAVFIWKFEYTEKNQPHIHMLMLDGEDITKDSFEDFKNIYLDAWTESVHKYYNLSDKQFQDMLKNSVDFMKIISNDDKDTVIEKYISKYIRKHVDYDKNKEQYDDVNVMAHIVGRFWGVRNRKNLEQYKCEYINIKIDKTDIDTICEEVGIDCENITDMIKHNKGTYTFYPHEFCFGEILDYLLISSSIDTINKALLQLTAGRWVQGELFNDTYQFIQ